jgi:hypothetical protein
MADVRTRPKTGATLREITADGDVQRPNIDAGKMVRDEDGNRSMRPLDICPFTDPGTHPPAKGKDATADKHKKMGNEPILLIPPTFLGE